MAARIAVATDVKLTQSAQGVLDHLSPGKHPAPVCSVTSSEVARFLRHFITGCATSCALVLRDMFFNLFVMFLSLASQAFLSFCADMSSFSHCLLLNIECPFLSSASSGLPYLAQLGRLGGSPLGWVLQMKFPCHRQVLSKCFRYRLVVVFI